IQQPFFNLQHVTDSKIRNSVSTMGIFLLAAVTWVPLLIEMNTTAECESSTSSTTAGLGVAFALAVLIAVTIFVYDRFWKGKRDQVERMPGMRHFTALIRYCRRKLGSEDTPAGLANQTDNSLSDDPRQSTNQDSPATRRQGQSKCRSGVPSEHVYWDIEPDTVNTPDEVVEEDQTEDADEEKAVMIVNSKSVGGNAENKEYSGRLAEYGEVADAKGMEGGTRPASVVQPSAASSASEPGAAYGEYIDFNVIPDGHGDTKKETSGRRLSSESGAANGEHVTISEVLELSKRQNDEDEKQ
ncbi:hypothetical protein BaRGS_00013390, partial [Batillaria attramentaria]